MKSFLVLFTCLFSLVASVSAQVPENAQDVSPLLIGEFIPNATLIDPTGSKVDLSPLLAEKPTVLVFYRGGWCPFCNRQLGALAESTEEIAKLGYQIVAISPDDFTVLQSTIDGNKIGYSLLTDPEGRLMKEIGIAFRTPDKTKAFINSNSKFTSPEVMPVPTVMVVSQKGEILFEYINPKYSTRIEKDLLLAVLRALPTATK